MKHRSKRLLDRVRDAIRLKGYSVRTVQELFGHKDVRTTMIYTHLLCQRKPAVRSSLDDLR